MFRNYLLNYQITRSASGEYEECLIWFLKQYRCTGNILSCTKLDTWSSLNTKYAWKNKIIKLLLWQFSAHLIVMIQITFFSSKKAEYQNSSVPDGIIFYKPVNFWIQTIINLFLSLTMFYLIRHYRKML